MGEAKGTDRHTFWLILSFHFNFFGLWCRQLLAWLCVAELCYEWLSNANLWNRETDLWRPRIWWTPIECFGLLLVILGLGFVELRHERFAICGLICENCFVTKMMGLNYCCGRKAKCGSNKKNIYLFCSGKNNILIE